MRLHGRHTGLHRNGRGEFGNNGTGTLVAKTIPTPNKL